MIWWNKKEKRTIVPGREVRTVTSEGASRGKYNFSILAKNNGYSMPLLSKAIKDYFNNKALFFDLMRLKTTSYFIFNSRIIFYRKQNRFPKPQTALRAYNAALIWI